MSSYKEELNNIHAPEDLILKTLNKVHEEEKKVEAENEIKASSLYKEETKETEDNSFYSKFETGKSRGKIRRVVVTISTLAAAAAVLLLAMSSGMFKGFSGASYDTSSDMEATTAAADNSSSAASTSQSNSATGSNKSKGNTYSNEESAVEEDVESAADMYSDDDVAESTTEASRDAEDSDSKNNAANNGNSNNYLGVNNNNWEFALAGGWNISSDVEVTAELQGVFDEALESFSGLEYTPVAYLGYKTVSTGTNSAYLCKATEDTGTEFWSVVYVNEDLNGKASLVNAPSIILSESSDRDTVQVGPASGGALVGAWEIADDYTLDDELKTSIKEAISESEDISYAPTLVMGSQVVSGTNYAVLCRTKESSADSKDYWTIVYFYKNLSGDVKVLNVATLNFEEE